MADSSRPHVTLQCAVSLDGFLDHRGPDRLILSSPEDLDRVDAVRAASDAILIGANTLRRDNPRLLIRSEQRQRKRVAAGKPPQLLRVVLAGTTPLPRNASLWTADDRPPLVICPNETAVTHRAAVTDGAEVVGVGGDRVGVGDLLGVLAVRGVRRLLVEGGGTVLTQFLSAGAFDVLLLSVAPFFVGDPLAPRWVHPATVPFDAAAPLRLHDVGRWGGTVVIEYRAS